MANYYQTLGISYPSHEEEIRLAYRSLAKKYHPDRNPGSATAEEQFKRINLAYQTLSDPQKKARYDQQIAFQQFQTKYQHRPKPQAPNQNHRPRPPFPRATTQAKAFSPEKERKSTAYAFGFVGLVTVIILITVTIRNQIQLEREEHLLQRQTELRGEFISYCKRGMVDSAVILIQVMQTENFAPGRPEGALKIVLENLYGLAKISFSKLDYEKTIFYGQLVNSHWVEKPIKDLNFWVAKSHIALGQQKQALAVLNYLITAYPYEVLPHLEAARMVIGTQPASGLQYYRGATDVLLNRYRSKYGEAFMLVMPPRNIPSEHFEVFLEAGLAFTQHGDLQIAESYLRWALHLNKARKEIYLALISCYGAMQKTEQRCIIIKKALQRGFLKDGDAFALECS